MIYIEFEFLNFQPKSLPNVDSGYKAYNMLSRGTICKREFNAY